MATPQAKRLRSSCSDEPATPSTPQPQIPALSNSFVGCPINSVDNLELFKLQVRAIPELVEVFQTVPELSDFVWLGGSANGNEASSKFNLFSKIKSMFSSATGNATSSKKLAANETVHMMPAAADNATDVDDTVKYTIGMPLDQLPWKQVGQLRVPVFMDAAFSFLRAESRLETVGIFRKAGVVRRRKMAARSMLNDLPFNEDEEMPTGLDVADALKEFLRELPERLVTTSLSPIFVAISIMQDYKTEEETMRALQLCHLAIPSQENRDALHALALFLSDVVSHQAANKMDHMALAKCIVPNLFHLDEMPESDIALFYERTAKLLARMIAQPNAAFTIPHMNPASAALAPMSTTPKSKRQRTDQGHENMSPVVRAMLSPKTPKSAAKSPFSPNKTPTNKASASTPGSTAGKKSSSRSHLSRFNILSPSKKSGSSNNSTPIAQSKLRTPVTASKLASSVTATPSTPSTASKSTTTPSSVRTIATRSTKMPFPFNFGNAFGGQESLLMPRGVKSSSYTAFAAPILQGAVAATGRSLNVNVNFTSGSSDRPTFK